MSQGFNLAAVCALSASLTGCAGIGSSEDWVEAATRWSIGAPQSSDGTCIRPLRKLATETPDAYVVRYFVTVADGSSANVDFDCVRHAYSRRALRIFSEAGDVTADLSLITTDPQPGLAASCAKSEGLARIITRNEASFPQAILGEYEFAVGSLLELCGKDRLALDAYNRAKRSVYAAEGRSQSLLDKIGAEAMRQTLPR